MKAQINSGSRIALVALTLAAIASSVTLLGVLHGAVYHMSKRMSVDKVSATAVGEIILPFILSNTLALQVVATLTLCLLCAIALVRAWDLGLTLALLLSILLILGTCSLAVLAVALAPYQYL